MTSLACALLISVPVLATAQPKRPKETSDSRSPEDWYKEGETQYNLGNFEKAVEAFKQGFALEQSDSKKAAYLFNIAQSYRQAKNCKDAQFFYKRYLALKDADTVKPISATKRQEIEDRIKELDECAKQQEAVRNKPPDQNEKPDGSETKPDPVPDPKRVADTTEGNPDEVDDGIVETQPMAPSKLSLRVVGGGAKLTAGDLPVPVQATFALIAGVPIAVAPKVSVEIGGGFTFTPVPFQDMAGQSKSAQLIGVVANVGGTYHLGKVGLRGDLGVGALVFSGAGGSPFTGFAPTSGALTMLHVRAGISADYAFTPNVIATLVPFAFSYSPAKEGLRDDIKSITAIDVMVGLGYRM